MLCTLLEAELDNLNFGLYLCSQEKAHPLQTVQQSLGIEGMYSKHGKRRSMQVQITVLTAHILASPLLEEMLARPLYTSAHMA